VRKWWQVRNLVELMAMLSETRDVEGLKIYLKTAAKDEEVPDMIDNLDELKNDLVNVGIDFSYDFVDDREFHERSIITDDGWKIILGRGLDIYEPTGKFSLATVSQDQRKCRDFNAIYTKIEK